VVPRSEAEWHPHDGIVMRRGWFCPLLNNAPFECGNWPALGGRGLPDRLSLGDLGGEGKHFFG